MRSVILVFLVLFLAVNCAPAPSDKVDLSKLRNSLMLASGGTVSVANKDDYNPILVQLPSNFLVLVFGSNRNGTHQIFVAKSNTAYDSTGYLPKFNNPAAFTGTSSASRIDFTAKVEGADVRIYFNEATGISKTLISNFTTPGSAKAAITNLANTNALGLKIRGIDDGGAKIFAATAGGVYYSFDPDLTTAPATVGYVATGTVWTAPLSLMDTGDNSAFFYIPSGVNSIGAATDSYDFGQNYIFSDALDQSGLYISHMSVLQNDTMTDPPWSRVVLFSAAAGSASGNGDLYVITSHSVSDFYIVNAILGIEVADTFSAPPADHDYPFDSDGFDYGTWGYLATGQDLTGTGITVPSASNSPHAGGFSALFASANANIGNFDLAPYYGAGFSISVWLYPTSNATTGYLFSNSATNAATSDGFRIYRNTGGSILLDTGNGSLSTTLTSTATAPITTSTHVVITVDYFFGMGTIYINGVMQGFGPIRPDSTPLGLVCVGGAPTGGNCNLASNFFAGSMDELKIFEDYVLSPAEVTALYNQ